MFIGGGGGKFKLLKRGAGGKLLNRGGGGGGGRIFISELSWLLLTTFCEDGTDKGWLLLTLRVSISFFSSYKSSSKKRLRYFCALNYFDPNVGGSRVLLNIAEDKDSDTVILSCSASFYLISRLVILMLNAYLKRSILVFGSVTCYWAVVFSSWTVLFGYPIFWIN